MWTRRNMLGAVAAGALAAGGAAVARVAVGRKERAGKGVSRRGRFPDVELWTHEGRSVRFFTDLVAGRVVAINMMYAQCEGICPRMTSNLLAVQEELGERLGQEVFMYSITLQPAHDTPRVLNDYVARQRVRPRWSFLTGAPKDIERVRYALGFYDLDPEVDGDKKQHTGMVRIGNEPLDRWTMTPALGKPDQIAAAILRVRTVSVTGA